jgi:hypothetical protein
MAHGRRLMYKPMTGNTEKVTPGTLHDCKPTESTGCNEDKELE